MVSSRPLIFAGSFIFLLSASLGFGGLDLILHAVIRQMFVLQEGSKVWNLWRTMPLPIYIRIRFFNITNPGGVAKGEKAVVREMGPYTYLEDWEKEDLSIDPKNDTVRYRMTKTYYFQPELSSGSEHDKITFINMILVSSAHVASDLDLDEFMMSQLNDMLAEKGEVLTKTATVREIIFDGVPVQAYVDLFNNPIVEEIAGELGLKLPEDIQDGKFAIFKHKNKTDDGWFVVKSGSEDSEELAKIVSYKGETLLKHWRGDSCNAMNGTDGTMYSPFLTREKVIHVFTPQICRSFALEYHSDSEVNGVGTYRFLGSAKNWMAPKSNPDNWCFCKSLVNKPELESCSNDGVFSIWPCSGGAPVLLSQPHFYGAEDWIRDGVDGLHPESEKHMTVMDFHPLTGSPLSVKGRMQLSIELFPYGSMSLFADVRRAIIPFLWIEEGSELEGWELFQLQLLDGFIKVFSYAKYILMTTGIVMFSAGAWVLYLSERKKRRETSPNPIYAETEIEESSLHLGPASAFGPHPKTNSILGEVVLRL